MATHNDSDQFSNNKKNTDQRKIMNSIFESTTGEVALPFPEYDAPENDPISLGQKWLQQAIDQKVREPRAMVLATANSSRVITSRVMAILKFTNSGIIFATHKGSRKIKDAEDVSFACGHFYWRELSRQLSVGGKVKQLDRACAVNEWNKRPIPLHAMSTCSRQSEPLISYKKLLTTAEELESVGALPCPDAYRVYILEPQAVEFWSSSSNRLHKRLRFERFKIGWKSVKLQP